VKLIAAALKFIPEDRCRQRCFDEAGGNEVESDGRELERLVFLRASAAQRLSEFSFHRIQECQEGHWKTDQNTHAGFAAADLNHSSNC